MKYLKKFNELNLSTYKSAAQKLKGIGHDRRSDVLSKYANDVANKAQIKRELDIYNRELPFGSFKLDICRNNWNATTKTTTKIKLFSGNFLISPAFMGDWAFDMFVDRPNHDRNYGLSLPFEFAIIAADEETKAKFLDTSFGNDIYDGMCWINRIWVSYLDDNLSLSTNGSHMEPVDSEEFYFENRQEAKRFKDLFVNALAGKNDWGKNKWSPNGLRGTLEDFLKNIENYINQENIKQGKDIESFVKPEHIESILESAKKLSLNQLYMN